MLLNSKANTWSEKHGRKQNKAVSDKLHVSNFPSLSLGRSTLINFGAPLRESESFLRAAVGVSERGLSGISFCTLHCLCTAVSMSGVRVSRSTSSTPFSGEIRPAKLVSSLISCKLHSVFITCDISCNYLLHKFHALWRNVKYVNARDKWWIFTLSMTTMAKFLLTKYFQSKFNKNLNIVYIIYLLHFS